MLCLIILLSKQNKKHIMKNYFRHILAIAVALWLYTPIFAHDCEVDGIFYNLNTSNKTAEVTYRGSAYNSYSNEYTGNIIIPERVSCNGTIYSVTSIGYDAFSGCTGLTSVTISNSVTSIGGAAFQGCTGLTSITIPNSVTSIGSSVFVSCTRLTSITIPNSVTSIGYDAFYNTPWYENQPDGVYIFR